MTISPALLVHMVAPPRKFRVYVLTAVVVTCFLLYQRRSLCCWLPKPRGGGPLKKPDLRFQKASFDWAAVPEHFPAQKLAQLPKRPSRKLPRVQHDFSSYRDDATTETRRRAVRGVFTRSWTSYKKLAWLHDELRPVSGEPNDPFGGWAATLVDNLDTLWIMGLEAEFYEAAAEAVQIDWNRTSESGINMFETTIRHLGGLLSAYDLSGEGALLAKAQELGDMLYKAFDTPNRMPGFWLKFEDVMNGAQVAGSNDPSASPGSLSLEFTHLAQHTGEAKYYDAVDRISQFLQRTQEESRMPGIWPTLINFHDQTVSEQVMFSLGGLADSLYEYLLKMYILLGGGEDASKYKAMYLRAMETVISHILFRPMLPDQKDVLFAGDVLVHNENGILQPDGQHLSCFLGGMFALGGKMFDVAQHVDIGARLTKGCAWAYSAFPTGLMPEIFGLLDCQKPQLAACEWDENRWRAESGQQEQQQQGLPKGFRHVRDPKYQLRPEAAESLFVMYRVTGDPAYRETAWTMFQSIVKYTETALAYSTIADVAVKGETKKTDSMESFWMAETLKYLFLIFCPPETISLDNYVLTTEAHPFRL